MAFPTGVGVNRLRRDLRLPGGAFPTGVGVNRGWRGSKERNNSIPHRRGGEPFREDFLDHCLEHSPQAWG